MQLISCITITTAIHAHASQQLHSPCPSSSASNCANKTYSGSGRAAACSNFRSFFDDRTPKYFCSGAVACDTAIDVTHTDTTALRAPVATVAVIHDHLVSFTAQCSILFWSVQFVV